MLVIQRQHPAQLSGKLFEIRALSIRLLSQPAVPAMDDMNPLLSTLTEPTATRERSRSRSLSSKEKRLRSLEAKVADMASRVETLEDSAVELRAKITTLERDKNFWRRFLVGLWKVFNGHLIESMASSSSQSGNANWEEPSLQATALESRFGPEDLETET